MAKVTHFLTNYVLYKLEISWESYKNLCQSNCINVVGMYSDTYPERKQPQLLDAWFEISKNMEHLRNW